MQVKQFLAVAATAFALLAPAASHAQAGAVGSIGAGTGAMVAGGLAVVAIAATASQKTGGVTGTSKK